MYVPSVSAKKWKLRSQFHLFAETYGSTRGDKKIKKTPWEEREKEEALERHKLSLKTHIDTLAKKNYQGIKWIKTVDTVIMFCPNESAISILPRQGGSKLFEYAIKNKVTRFSKR